MRRALLFVIASALLSTGLYLLYLQLVVSGNAMGKVTLVGFTMALLGGYLLWADFIAPREEGKE